MLKLLLIGLGGFVGAILRYVTGSLVTQLLPNLAFPYGTFVVNIIGCLLIGVLTRLTELSPELLAQQNWIGQALLKPEIRALIFIGFLGAFTTFSTFSNEGLALLQKSRFDVALLYVGGSVFVGLAAVWLGRQISF
ncbi:MAG: fluoride efflux transporter CrcB [Chloroflexota bacterium]